VALREIRFNRRYKTVQKKGDRAAFPRPRFQWRGDRDRRETAPVMIINESMARQFWGNSSPIGRQMRQGLPDENLPWYTVIGVVADTRVLLDYPPGPKIYIPYAQVPEDYEDLLERPFTMVIRTSDSRGALIQTLRKIISDTDPTLAFDIRPAEEVISESLSQPRFRAVLFALFAGVAIWLSTLGVYGVISSMVVRETRAIGIRLALGASKASIRKLVFRRGMTIALLGLAIGLFASLFVMHLLSSLFFEIQAINLTLFAVLALLLAVVSAIAIYIPSCRAVNIDPVRALSAE